MESKVISKFFTAFTSLYILFISISIFAVVTGFDKYESLQEAYWKEPAKATYYAARLNKGKTTQFANANKGEVYAGIPNPITWVTSAATKAAVKAATEYICAEEQNSYGIVGCTVTNGLNLVIETVGGKTYNNFKEDGGLDESPILKGIEKSEEPLALNPNVVPGIPRRSALYATAVLGKNIYGMQDSLFSLSTYAQSEVAQIPVLGAKAANAAWWKGSLETVALGDGFFNLWKGVRNVSYYLIIIPTIFLGFAIMFRAQINPQTQITLLNIIPRLLIVMLLITFSYPIFVVAIKLAEPLADLGSKLVFDTIFSISPLSFSSINVANAGQLGLGLIALLGALITAPALLGFIGILLLLPIVIFLLAFIGAVIRYLIGVVILITKIGLLIAFGPLVILASAFPGREPLLKNYFLTVLSNIFGLSLVSIMWALALGLMWIGVTSNPLILFAITFVAVGIIWKAPSAPKLLAGMLGVQPLFAQGQQRR